MRALPFRRLVVLVLVVLVTAGCSGKNAVDQQAGGQNRFVEGQAGAQRFAPGRRPGAPVLTGEAVTGTPIDTGKYRGRVLVVNFWGSWCAPCRAEADTLADVYATSHPQGVEFLGVNVRDGRDNAVAFEQGYRIGYPSLFDPDGRVALTFRKTPPVTIPATILIDRHGRVAVVFRSVVGYSDLSRSLAELEAEK